MIMRSKERLVIGMKQFLTLYGFYPLLPIGIAPQIIILAMNRCKSYADKHTSPDIA